MSTSKNHKNKNQKNEKQKLYNYAKYSALGFQMVAIILAGVWGGRQLDNYFDKEFPLFTVILSFVSVILALYYSLKDFIRFK